MVNKIKNHIKERKASLEKALVNAREMYGSTKKNKIANESWAGRIGELTGRIEELDRIAKIIQRHEEIHHYSD